MRMHGADKECSVYIWGEWLCVLFKVWEQQEGEVRRLCTRWSLACTPPNDPSMTSDPHNWV